MSTGRASLALSIVGVQDEGYRRRAIDHRAPAGAVAAHSTMTFVNHETGFSFIDNDWNVLAWESRQYVTDNAAERQKRYRDKLRNALRNACDPSHDHVTHVTLCPHRESRTEPECSASASRGWYGGRRRAGVSTLSNARFLVPNP